MDHEKHYLEAELEELFRTDPRMWRFVQQGSLDGVWYWDIENPSEEWMSPEMWRVFGVDPSTKRHDPAEWQDLIFPEDLDVALRNFEAHCADPDHPYDQIVRYRHADGSTIWVRCRGVAIRDKAGKPIRMLGAHNDITPLMRAQERARSALEQTSAANDELRSFAYGISHDLKSPTNTVGMLLREIVETGEGTFTEEQRELLGMAEHTIEHMRQQVDEMLAYTRLIGVEFKKEIVDLNCVLSDVRRALASDIENAKAELIIETMPVLEANSMQMGLLFQNLVENALKYRHDERPSVIRIHARQADPSGAVEIVVADNGIGIEEEHVGRIFDMFTRLHRRDEYPGTGLGLTLCRRIMLNHEGEISVSSRYGEGTEFIVKLPRTLM